MKYFTYELFQAMQPKGNEQAEEAAEQQWYRNGEAYEKQLQLLTPTLFDGFRWLAETTLHDGVIRRAAQPTPSEVIIAIDADNNPWGETGQIELHFSGVQSVQGLQFCHEENCWLYEELLRHEAGGPIELNVLLEDGELQIIAERLRVKQRK